MVETAVVILNYNGQSYLEQFLPSVLEHSENVQIVVADNGSNDDSITFMKEHYPAVTLLELPDNYGFCGGYNRALKQIEATYYVLLNSDVEVAPEWLTPLVDWLKADDKHAVCQPKMLAYHQKSHFEHAGGAGGFIDYLGYPFCRGRIFNITEEDQGQYNDTIPIFWATGACFAIKASLYHQMGGLDELFFAHMEEIDLCWRLQRAGYTIGYCGNSKVYHVGGGTLQQESPRKAFLNFRNGLFLLYKNLPSHKLLPILFIRMLLDGVAGFKFLTEGKNEHLLAILRAHFAFYSSLGVIHQKRKALQYLPNKIALKTIYNKSIVKAFFLEGKRKYQDL